MQYESVKASILEYKLEKKKKQTQEEKSIFRWKLCTLGLAVLVIVFVGVLSQLFKQMSEDGVGPYNTSFLPGLLDATKQLETAKQITNFLIGFNESKIVKFNKIKKFYEDNATSSISIRQGIHGRQNLLYILRLSETNKFGFFIQKQFPQNWEEELDKYNFINVSESRSKKSSMIFNINNQKSFLFNLKDQCTIYKYQNQIGKQQMNILQLFTFNQLHQPQVTMHIQNQQCYDIIDAGAKIFSLTGILLQPNQTRIISLNRLQIYQLSYQA